MSNALSQWDPFRELDAMQEQMNRLLNRSLGTGAMSSTLSTPLTDIYEEDGKLVIETALPYFKDEEVEVQVNQDRLEVKAEHATSSEDKQRNYLRRESTDARYYRQFLLPKDVDTESAHAAFDNGVLKVTFAQRELPQPKKLQLQSGKARDRHED